MARAGALPEQRNRIDGAHAERRQHRDDDNREQQQHRGHRDDVGIEAPRPPERQILERGAYEAVRQLERATREVTFFELGRRIEAVHEPHAEQAALAGRPPPEWLKKRRAFVVVQKRLKREAKQTWSRAKRNSTRPKAP